LDDFRSRCKGVKLSNHFFTKRTKTKAKASNPIAVKPRSIHNEASIKSILARSGKDTFPRTKSFKYGSHATMNKARRDAEKWLQEMGA
jgi:hypothetical protein